MKLINLKKYIFLHELPFTSSLIEYNYNLRFNNKLLSKTKQKYLQF